MGKLPQHFLLDLLVIEVVIKLHIVSSARHFGQSVSRLALNQPVLYYACPAYASHVMTLQAQLKAEDEA